MSDKALGMLKHMRRQIVGQPAPYVEVRRAAISIEVWPLAGANAMAWSMNCCRPDASNPTPAPALPRTGCTDLPIRAYPRPTRQIAPLRYGRVSGGSTEAVVEEGVREVTWAPRPCSC